MEKLRKSLHFYYAGAVILLALVLGGGTDQGLWTDHLIEIALLPALFLGLARVAETRLTIAAKILCAAIVCLMIVQFLPVMRLWPLPELGPDVSHWAFYSPAPQKGLESSLFAIGALGFFLFLSRFSDTDQERLLNFLMVGLFVNLIAATVELSYGHGVAAGRGLFPYSFGAGLFANQNHFSSLVYAMIPVLAYLTLQRRRVPAAYLGFLILMLLVLFAAGSRAGMAIATMLAVISLLWFWPRTQSPIRKLAVLAVGILIIAGIAWRFGFDSSIQNDLRSVFYATTWRAIRDHWLAGTGLGTFTLIYPSYERTGQIVSVYANHAHDEYLELWLETGLAGLVLVGIFCCLVARHFSRSGLAEASFIAIVAIMLHSLVDYPMRTFGLTIPFAFFAATILSVRPHSSGEEIPPPFGHATQRRKVRHRRSSKSAAVKPPLDEAAVK
jgi:O-antigen ligase